MNTVKIVSTNKPVQSITPSKVVCIGRNYVEHIKELDNEMPDEMVVFLKPNSAISHVLHATHNADTLHYEAELSFIYQGGKFVAVGLGLDLTKRDIQSKLKVKGLPWERAKAFDNSAVFSEFVSVASDNINELVLSLNINGTPKQQGGVSLMMVKPDEILAELQSFLTLADGDIVMTGTPKGVGIVKPGDTFIGQVATVQKNNTLNRNLLVDCQWQAQ